MLVLNLHSVLLCVLLFVGSSLTTKQQPGAAPPQKRFTGPEQRCSGKQPKKHSIVGGTVVDSLDDFPFVAWIGDDRIRGQVSQFCGGTLIHPQIVLTAGHCLYNDKWKNSHITVRFRLTNSAAMHGTERTAVNWMRHSDYSVITLFGDLGLIMLNESIPEEVVKPVLISDGTQAFERKGDKTIVGWGSMDEGCSVYDTNMRKATVPLGTYGPECTARGSRTLTRAHDYDVKRQLCAGDYDGQMHYPGCGDSGGPLLATSKGRWVQVGLVSWSYGVPFPDVFTRVSHYKAWIQRGIAQLLKEGKRADVI